MFIKRTTILISLAAGMLVAAVPAAAQRAAEKVQRVGVLMNLYATDAAPPQALRQALRELGHVEGRNLVFDWRYQLGGSDRLAAMAAELVQMKPDVIVADSTLAIRAAIKATATIPIVMASSADPIVSGFVRELGRPTGNVTGIAVMLEETSAKRLQLLKEVAPQVSRIAVLVNPSLAWHKAMLKDVQVAASPLSVQALAITVRSRGDFGDAFAQIAHGKAQALLVSETMTPQARTRLVDFAMKNQMPAMFMNREYVIAGGLMSYAPDFPAAWRQSARYVDKILRGAKPEDLPVEMATGFEFIINLKTAKAIGLTFPPSVLVRANEVIQ